MLPLFARHVEVRAQRPPHVAGFDTGLDRLCGGPAAQSGQHVVHKERRTPHRAELGLDEFVEFGQAHDHQPTQSLPGRLPAHLDGIGHAGDALPRPSRRLPIAGAGQHFADLCDQQLRSQRAN